MEQEIIYEDWGEITPLSSRKPIRAELQISRPDLAATEALAYRGSALAGRTPSSSFVGIPMAISRALVDLATFRPCDTSPL